MLITGDYLFVDTVQSIRDYQVDNTTKKDGNTNRSKYDNLRA
jgi:hypothetical protein